MPFLKDLHCSILDKSIFAIFQKIDVRIYGSQQCAEKLNMIMLLWLSWSALEQLPVADHCDNQAPTKNKQNALVAELSRFFSEEDLGSTVNG